MDTYAKIAIKIIQEQEGIIGPIALEQANKVAGLSVDWGKHEVAITGDERDVVDHLVAQYEHLFGRASVEVCREAVKDIVISLPQNQRPQSLQ
jgi:hypothetical protein